MPEGYGRKKASYVGAPEIFALELACRQINEAFGVSACYLVGSSTERADWRDIDIRCILDDVSFVALFPDAGAFWEHDARWLLMTTSISQHLSSVTGLPIDFQFQPQTHANERHKGQRHAMGMKIFDRDKKAGGLYAYPDLDGVPADVDFWRKELLYAFAAGLTLGLAVLVAYAAF